MSSKINGANYKDLNVNEIDSIVEDLALIDIREPDEYNRGHLPSAKNIPMKQLIEFADDYLDKSKEYHIVCHSGGRSARICRFLASSGFNVVNLAGGTMEYKGKIIK
ncbi:MAG: rhodanese-like domain-containing protein [Clostridium sp.]